MQNSINCNVQSFYKLGTACNFGEPLRKPIAFPMILRACNPAADFSSRALSDDSYPSILTNIVKEFPSRHIFHHHEEVCGSADHLIPATHQRTTETQLGALLLVLSTHSNTEINNMDGQWPGGHCLYHVRTVFLYPAEKHLDFSDI